MKEAASHRAAQRVENLPPHELADLLGAVQAKQAA